VAHLKVDLRRLRIHRNQVDRYSVNEGLNALISNKYSASNVGKQTELGVAGARGAQPA
jgi:hypothetical protein